MATTTNYGWETPDDTDLVKDGAAAIRTLGSSIDTTTKNLNPETTLGDLAYRSATANVKTRLALGSANQVLQVNSGATAPEWAAILAGTSFTPSFGGLTIGNGTNSGRFILQNKLLYVEGKFTLGSTSSVTGQITLTLPSSKSFAVNNTAPIGFCRLEDTGTAFYAGNVVQNSSTAVALQRFGVTGSLIFYGSVDATNPFTWTTGDVFSYCFTCEVA